MKPKKVALNVGTPGMYLIHVPSIRENATVTFDIFRDQKIAFDKLQIAAIDRGHEKPKIRDMLQEAIDNYVTKMARELGNVIVERAPKRPE